MKSVTIHYFYDALCGWCFGFSPVINKIRKEYKDRFNFEIYSGGMVSGSRVGPIGVVAPYIKTAYKDVEERTGVKFGEKFINNILMPGTAVIDSDKPSRALSLVKYLKKEMSFDFASDLHNQIYVEGKEVNKKEMYEILANKYKLPSSFYEDMNTELNEERTEKDYDLVEKFEVNGFPHTVAEVEGKFYLISRGYTDFDSLKKIFLEIEKIAN
jgi:putative protein-disulfide isomerase